MINYFSPEMRRNPYPFFAQMRRVSPLLHVESHDLWMIFDYENVKRALNDPEAFNSRSSPPGSPGPPPEWLVFFDPPRHTKLRALISRGFTPRAIANLEPRIRELSRQLLDEHVEHGEMDLAGDYSVPLALMVIAEMIGIPLADRPRFKRWSDATLNLADTVSGDFFEAEQAGREYGAVAAEMSAYVAGLLEERRARPMDDLLSRLVHAEVDGERLTPAELLGFFTLLLVAGNETTANLVNNAILCFIEHPDQLARVKAAPDLLPSAIEEVLRYRSPFQAVFRTTRCAIEMHRQVIPPGQLVLPMIGAANRDPQHFPDAERFDVTRDPNPHIAFGHGIHFCLGAPLARLEARIALTDLLGRLRGLELAGDEPCEPRKAFHVLGPSRLPIRFERGRRMAPGTRTQ
jgi:cytochrome P450